MGADDDIDFLDAVYDALYFNGASKCRVFMADDRDDLNRLAQYCLQRNEHGRNRLALINQPASPKAELTPYLALLESFIRKQCSEIRNDVLNSDGAHILNMLSGTLPVGERGSVGKLIPDSNAASDENLQSLRVAQELEFFSEYHFPATFACLSLPVKISSPHRTNGLQPVVWLFDDDFDDPSQELPVKNQARAQALKDVERQLNLVVECKPVKCRGGGNYSDAQDVLRNLEKTEQVAAFIVDLDWGAEGSPPYMGHRAADLLSDLFPEIPVYVYTGIHDLGALQTALQYGADWCFLKPVAHGTTIVTAQPDRFLDVASLAVALNRSVLLRYAAYDSPPRPDLGTEIPPNFDSESWGAILGKLFPGITKCIVIKKLGGGFSGAMTYFVRVDRERPGAISPSHMTYFLKANTWPVILREYSAVRRIIETRLGSHVPNLVGPPVLPRTKDGGMPMGALAYSTAGLPENLDDLQSFFEVLRYDLLDGKGERALHILRATLTGVLFPLHRVNPSSNTTIWKHWGTFLPPLVIGELIDDPQALIESPIDACDNPFRAVHESNFRDIYCNNLTLSEWAWDAESHNVTTISPHTIIGIASPGYRVEIFSKRPDLIKRHFGPLWARHGMQVSVCFRAAPWSNNQQGFRRFREAADLWQQKINERKWPAPFEFFTKDRPFSASLGAIHGDLNLENILICSASDVGTLIDFEYASDMAPVAYDLATLEAQLCNRILFPEINRLSQAVFVGENRSLPIFDLLEAALDALNQTNAPEFFRLRLSAILGFQLSEDLTRAAAYVLELCEVVRRYGRNDLRLTDAELHMSLAVYFTVAGATFTDQVDRNMSLASAAYHLSKLDSLE